MRQVGLRDAGGLHIWAELRDDGTLVFQGQDLRSPFGGEYEYAITVLPADVPTVVRALGGGADDDVLDLLSRHADDVVGAGEKSWLRGLGIRTEFWSRAE